jgi:hypothetical protein
MYIVFPCEFTACETLSRSTHYTRSVDVGRCKGVIDGARPRACPAIDALPTIDVHMHAMGVNRNLSAAIYGPWGAHELENLPAANSSIGMQAALAKLVTGPLAGEAEHNKDISPRAVFSDNTLLVTTPQAWYSESIMDAAVVARFLLAHRPHLNWVDARLFGRCQHGDSLGDRYHNSGCQSLHEVVLQAMCVAPGTEQ